MEFAEWVSDDTLEQRAGNLELLLLDVDGVLTDGKIILTGDESETKQFDVKDGMGVTLAQQAGIDVGIITGRVSDVVRRRAEELNIEHVFQDYTWKDEALDQVQDRTNLSTDAMGFVGDDILDLAVMSTVGLSFAPADAHESVRNHCSVRLDSPGGDGAIREAVDGLLELRGQKETVYDHFSRGDYSSLN